MSGGEDELVEPKPPPATRKTSKTRKSEKRKTNAPPSAPSAANAFSPAHPQLSGGGMSDHGYFHIECILTFSRDKSNLK